MKALDKPPTNISNFTSIVQKHNFRNTLALNTTAR